MKKCPYCGEEIQDLAKKCKFCGERLKEGSREKPIEVLSSNWSNDFLGTFILMIKRNLIRIVIIGGIIGYGSYIGRQENRDTEQLRGIQIIDENNNINEDILSDIENTKVISSKGKTEKEFLQAIASNEMQYADKIDGLDLGFLDSYYTNTYQLNSLIENYKLYKQYNDEYINGMISIFNKYSVDTISTVAYSIGEKISKIKLLINYENAFADSTITQLEYLISIQDNISIGENGELLMDNDNDINRYNILAKEASNASDVLNSYLEEYNIYMSEWNTYNKAK